MKIVIVGGGAVGEAIIANLWSSTDIILIDHDPQTVDRLFNQYDIQAVLGDGTDYQLLEEADIYQADVFISVTNSDEENILAAIFSRQFGVDHVYARVRQAKYYRSMEQLHSQLGIERIINPEWDAALEIKEILDFPSANRIEHFLDKQLNMVEIRLKDGDRFVGEKLDGFRQGEGRQILAAAIERQGQVLIPTGSDRLQAGDLVHFISQPADLQDFLAKQLADAPARIRSLFIVGAGNVSSNLLRLLAGQALDIKLVEKNPQLAQRFAQNFPSVRVICADGTDQAILQAEGIQHYDCCLALTAYDETNLVIGLLAQKWGLKKVITQINRTDFYPIAAEIGLDSWITPKLLIADKIIRLVRSLKASQHASITNFHQILDGRVEVIEFQVLSPSKITRSCLKDLDFIKPSLVVCIYRQGQIIIPTGDDQIQLGDRLVLVSQMKGASDLSQLVR